MIRFLDFLRKIFPWCVRHYNRLQINGITNLPKKGSAIIAPNHSGGFDLDNFVLMSALEHFKTNNPARKRIWLCYWDKWAVEDPIWGALVQKFSPIPISLTGKGIPYNLVDKLIERGEFIAIMPEGHSASYREGYQIWKFYPGVIKLHLKYKIPIIPTACLGFSKAIPILSNKYNSDEVPPWENEVFFPISFPRKLIIHFGKPIMFEDYFDQEVDKTVMFKLANIVRQKVKETISIYRIGISRKNPFGKKRKSLKIR